jgi:putative hydroxymethylpyrimidine transport system permease protein
VRRLVPYLGTIAILLALIGAWELYTVLSGIDRVLFPSPADVASSLWHDRALLWSNFKVTAGEVLLGILCAARSTRC